MWLRTSAGNPLAGFDMFLCYGEGVFADCVDWVPAEEKWPAGDQRDEDDDEDGDGGGGDGQEEDDIDDDDYLLRDQGSQGRISRRQDCTSLFNW